MLPPEGMGSLICRQEGLSEVTRDSSGSTPPPAGEVACSTGACGVTCGRQIDAHHPPKCRNCLVPQKASSSRQRWLFWAAPRSSSSRHGAEDPPLVKKPPCHAIGIARRRTIPKCRL